VCRKKTDELQLSVTPVPIYFLIFFHQQKQQIFFSHKEILLSLSLSLESYSVFQGFSKAKFANGGSILSSSQFSILPQIAQKMTLASKVVKIDSKIIILLLKI
jgi:hypothetical protein